MELSYSDVSVAIISRGRAGTIRTHRLVPEAVVCVPESEVAEYEEACPGMAVLPYPDRVSGVGPVKNWVLDHVEGTALVILDDDLYELVMVDSSNYYRYADPKVSRAVILNTAQMALDAGVGAFGWSQRSDVRIFRAFEPFRLNGFITGAMGVLDRNIRWDDSLLARCDLDWTLQHLLQNRIVWVDQRWNWKQYRNTNTGGNAVNRSTAQTERDIQVTRERWGRFVTVKRRAIGITTYPAVPRRGKLQLD
jgi:hypothetical protein